MGIPDSERAPGRAHVDSDILRYVFDPLEEDVDLREIARSLFFSAGTTTKLPVVCSAPAAGEFLLVLANDRRDNEEGFQEALRLFWQYVRDDRLRLFLFGQRDTEAFSCSREVQVADPIIDATDAAIVGCFLADPTAVVLYTTDQELILSRAISDLARGRGKNIRGL